MEEKRETPAYVNNVVHHINEVADRLKLLYESGNGDLDGYREHAAFRDIAQMVLKNEIKELNTIMEDLSRGNIEYDPVEI